jgi:hypothetical protein
LAGNIFHAQRLGTSQDRSSIAVRRKLLIRVSLSRTDTDVAKFDQPIEARDHNLGDSRGSSAGTSLGVRNPLVAEETSATAALFLGIGSQHSDSLEGSDKQKRQLANKEF